MQSRKQNRQEQILMLLSHNGKLSPKELADTLGVSLITIRRDIDEMSARKLISTFYGGVSLLTGSQEKISPVKSIDLYHAEQEMHYLEKMRIAKYAYSIIEPQDVIGIDNGTTCSHILDYFDSNTNCLIYTYSYRILNELNKLHNDNVQLFLLGGYYHKKLQMFEYTGLIDIIPNIHINKLFLGTVGVSLSGELSCVQPYEVDIRKALMKQSNKIYLLTDSSKIGKSWYDKYGMTKDITAMITDIGITIEQKSALEKTGIEVITV